MPTARIIGWTLLLVGLLLPAWALSGRREATPAAPVARPGARRSSQDAAPAIRGSTDLPAARYAGWMDAEEASEEEDGSESDALWHASCPLTLPDGPRPHRDGPDGPRIFAPAPRSPHRRC